MSQTKTLVMTLKKVLRSHGITYADIASHLQLSEASIKRMFAQQSFSLDRLNTICSMVEMDLVDLVRIVDDEQEKLTA
ncbi:MAG: helix-turn-helix transcriptional regulator [Proteobacteria bacterium]|nr:helix-turn-helix transcriptional regulator [Pseudomonadota bacterium]